MKKKIKLVNKINNKTIEKEINIPNKLHFEIQKNNRSVVF